MYNEATVQKYAKEGYTTIRFPKGETAAKIEGHQTIANELESINNKIKEIEVSISKLDNANEQDYQEIERLETEKDSLEQQKQNLKTQGIEKLKPIETFYEIRIGNILDKQFGKDNVKEYIDEFGNKWKEVTINQERDLDAIEMDIAKTSIYDQLGNKTASNNVIIYPIYQERGVQYAKTINGIFALRVNNSQKHFGNPFTSIPAEITKGLVATKSTKESVKRYINWILNGANFDKKNLFSVVPKQVIDKKAVVKSSIATQYIGFGKGIANSSTELYRQQAGQYANTGNYSEKDIIFVSIGGKRGDIAIRKEQQDKTIKEAIKALETGAVLITDNRSYVNSSDYNEGEKRLAQNLIAKGYKYFDKTIDGQVLGIWYKGETNPQRREWIREQLISGVLKNRPIVYYQELHEPSHATALDYLINKYDWTNNKENANEEVIEEVDNLDKPIDFEKAIKEYSKIIKEKQIEGFSSTDMLDITSSLLY